jgi:hypothetical protein
MSTIKDSIISRLSSLPAPLTLPELSIVIGKKETTIRSNLTGKNKQRYVPRCEKLPNSSRWQCSHASIIAWLNSKKTSKRRGRPTKKEEIAKREITRAESELAEIRAKG